MVLRDLVFSDLFVAESAADSWYKATPDSLTVQPVPADCEMELSQLRQHLKSHPGKTGFRVEWPVVEGIRLRVERIAVAEGKEVYVCRRFRLAPGTLASLGMPAGVATKLLAADLVDGLVVFFGKAGSGKSTTAASLVSERLSQFGGVCWTVENPTELPLQGRHGNGWCYQTEVSDDEEIGPAIKRLMRATPNIIFIGEMRDGQAVREAIAAATSGHLVVATFHASDLISGIARLARLAERRSGAKTADASAALAEALKVAVHLTLHNHEPGKSLSSTFLTLAGTKGTGTPARVLSVEPIWLHGPLGDGVRSIVRDGEFHLLTSEIDRQRRSFIMGKLP